jgi:hypothetical protein
MRITSAGNVGIGITPSAWYTGYTALQVGFSGSIFSNKTSADTNTTMIGNNAFLNSAATNWIYQNNGFATRYAQVSGGHEFYTAASGTAGNAITWGTAKMTITSGGNVGIGTSSPSMPLDIVGTPSTGYTSTRPMLNLQSNQAYSTAPYTGINFSAIYNSGGGATSLAFIGGGKETSGDGVYGGYLKFSTRTDGASDIAERMRITSGGGINTYGPYLSMDGAGLSAAPAGLGYGLFPYSSIGLGISSVVGMRFLTGSTPTTRMSIDSSGNIGAPTGSNIYNASDRRLKQNIETISNGLDKIIALNPVKFNWIDNFVETENGKDMLGFIAQEVDLIIPEAVEKFNQNTIQVGDLIINDTLRVNEKFLIPVLVKAIQEQQAQIEELKQLIKNK